MLGLGLGIGVWTPDAQPSAPVVASYLLLETGTDILLAESGDKLTLE